MTKYILVFLLAAMPCFASDVNPEFIKAKMFDELAECYWAASDGSYDTGAAMLVLGRLKEQLAALEIIEKYYGEK